LFGWTGGVADLATTVGVGVALLVGFTFFIINCIQRPVDGRIANMVLVLEPAAAVAIARSMLRTLTTH
jgi:hypothetical protein